MAEQGLYHGLRLAGVTAAEEDGMIEDMVEIVEIHPHFMAGREGPGFLIGLVERGRKATEEPCHGQISLPVSKVDGGIKDDWISILQGPGVTAPEVTVQEGRGRGFLEKAIEMIEEGVGTAEGKSAVPGQPEHVSESLFP